MRSFALLAFAALGIGFLILQACEHNEVTQPSTAVAAVSRTLTVSGTGTGTGRIKSTPAGIDCTITAGTPAATGCTAPFAQGTTVKLSQTPSPGHAFGGWTSTVASCAGIGACTVRMGGDRAVSALFRKGPFTIEILSGTGSGSGTVTSQPGLTPAIDCTITDGTAAATGCSATYPANTSLTLSAVAFSGFVFAGWNQESCGTGTCGFKVIQGVTVRSTFAADVSGSAATEGKWEAPFATPMVGVHAHLLRTGKVLLWGDSGSAYLWSSGSTFTRVDKPFQIYCTGHTFLANGRLLVMGGTSANTRGLKAAAVFDPLTSTWTNVASMFKGRYYPTATTLPSGGVLVVSGHDDSLKVVTIPEIWTGSGWRKLTGAPRAVDIPFYPDMFVAPDGRVFMAGFPQATALLDTTGTGQWIPVGNRKVADRRLGSAVMYAPGKILYAGGGGGPVGDTLPTNAAEVIDLNQPTPSWASIAPMAFARRQMNATLLADGTVLVTGGTRGPGFNNQAQAVHYAELWNPATGAWKLMAREPKTRTYHSTALLLPSGKVLSTGGGEGGGIPYANAEFSAQLYSPPYLFKADGSLAARPGITTAPAKLTYNQPFTVQSPNAASVTRGTLIRLSSVTHAFNQSQLINHLTFTRSGTSGLTATAPANANLAPPGPYMLFLINGSGVPSVAKIVMVGK